MRNYIAPAQKGALYVVYARDSRNPYCVAATVSLADITMTTVLRGGFVEALENQGGPMFIECLFRRYIFTFR